MIKPFIKYTGSKFPYLNDIKNLLPEKFTKVFIPFLGSGSFITLFKNHKLVCSDLNEDVISVFKSLLYYPEYLKNSYELHHKDLAQFGNLHYEFVRGQFNKMRRPEDFLFLTRTCYNGLIRYNKNNEFNVSFHHTRKGITPEKLNKIIDEWYNLLKLENEVSFLHEDYRTTVAKCKSDSLVIADPPYILTRGQYLAQKFDFAEFEFTFNDLSRKNVKWMITLDDNENLVRSKLPNLKGFYTKTSAKHSSLSNLKNRKCHKGNTVIINYG